MCFHNSMSAKAIKVAARYGRQSDVVEIHIPEHTRSLSSSL